MTSYNLSTLSRVDVFKKRINRNWVWKPNRKILGFINSEAGFYRTSYDRNQWHENPPEGCYLENGVVYRNPYVILTFTNGHSYSFDFETVEKLMKEVKDIKRRSKCEWYED